MVAVSLMWGFLMGCEVENCDKDKIKARGLCAAHYERWRRRSLEGETRTYRHLLTGIDPVTRVATCKVCGPTKVRQRGGGGWRCTYTGRRRSSPYAARPGEKDPTGQIARLRAVSDGSCDICGQVPLRPLFVDHCHDTETIRGLLCMKCNIGLSNFADDPARLSRAAEYLMESLTAASGDSMPPTPLATIN